MNKNDFKTCDNIRKIANSQGDGYTSVCLLDYSYFKECFKKITINSVKHQSLDADPKAIKQFRFTQTEMETQQSFSLLNKQKKQF